MPASFGVNLRVTGHCSRGGRKYMEDFFSVAYQASENETDLEYAFIGIYDGHGGSEAARFAKENLINLIVSQKLFWSDNDDDILRAIREGYIDTHYAMWREQEKWPKTAAGLPSTAGTTASVAFIRHGKIYIGHAGDSGIVLGYTEEEDDDKHWRAMQLTQEHKPESNIEKSRIVKAGGKVVIKSGVPRVVWNRPRIGHKGPVRRSTPIDEIPFLAVARSLGDLWSYNSALNKFVVSPDPDVRVIKINPKKFRCLIFGTDGLWNVISASSAVEIARYAEQMNEKNTCNGETQDWNWTNPSKCLVDKALEQWSTTRMRADNTSVVIIMIDPPGLPKREVLKSSPRQLIVENTIEAINDEGSELPINMKSEEKKNFTIFDHSTKEAVDLDVPPAHVTNVPAMQTSGVTIMTRNEAHPASDCIENSKFEFAYASPCSHLDLNYLQSFEDSYDFLINPEEKEIKTNAYSEPLSNIHNEYMDDTYSLTRLETVSEKNRSISENDPTLSEVAGADHYCLPSTSTSSSSSCDYYFNTETHSDSEDDSVNDDDVHMLDKDCDGFNSNESVDESPIDNIIVSSPAITTSINDETIQIHEISSSSKENDDKTGIELCAPELRSSKNDGMRMTRSKQTTLLRPKISNRKTKTLNKVFGALRKSITAIKEQSVNTQNENSSILSRMSPRRSCVAVSSNLNEDNNQQNTVSSDLDLCKRTLRSKNLLTVKEKPLSTTSPITSTSSGIKANKLKSSKTQVQNMLNTSNIELQTVPMQLRDKTRINVQMSQVKVRPLLKNTSSKKLASPTVNARNNSLSRPSTSKPSPISKPISTRNRLSKRLRR